MSPIIYTRHRCDPAEDPELQGMKPAYLEGATWQCPECDAYWEPLVHKAGDGAVLRVTWECTGRPKEQAHIREVEAALDGSTPAQPEPPTTPRVTPDMVQLVLDTYSDHTVAAPNDGAEPLGWCGECETGIYEPHTIQAHAREITAEVLRDALAKAGRDAQE